MRTRSMDINLQKCDESTLVHTTEKQSFLLNSELLDIQRAVDVLVN